MIPNALILALCSVCPFSLLPLPVTSLGSCPSPRCSLSSGCCRHGSLKTLCVILLFLTVVAPSLVAVSLAAARRLAEGKEAVLSTRLFLLLVRLKDLAGLVKKWQKISRRRSSTRSEITFVTAMSWLLVNSRCPCAYPSFHWAFHGSKQVINEEYKASRPRQVSWIGQLTWLVKCCPSSRSSWSVTLDTLPNPTHARVLLPCLAFVNVYNA